MIRMTKANNLILQDIDLMYILPVFRYYRFDFLFAKNLSFHDVLYKETLVAEFLTNWSKNSP